MKREYPYLISSLPELAFDFDSNRFNFFALKQEVKDNLDIRDWELVEDLFRVYDNQNFLNSLLGKELGFSEKGSLSKETIAESLLEPTEDTDTRSNQTLPAYLSSFIQIRNSANNEDKHELYDICQDSPENALYTLFYNEMAKSKNRFLREWFDADCNIRNLQAAIVSRRLNIDATNCFVGKHAKSFLKSKSSDFDLGDDIEWLTKFLQIVEIPETLERERKIDLLRWEIINEISVYNYFDVDAVLAFMQKVDIVDRWLSLDKETGKEMFQKLLHDLMSTCDTKKVFAQAKK